MAREADCHVAADGERAADGADQERVDYRAHLIGLIEDAAEVVEGEHVGELDALAPLLDESAQRDAGNRHDDGEDEPQGDDRQREPFPAAQRQELLPRRLALDRNVLARCLQEPALQQNQREGHRDDAHRDRGHQMVGRRAELVGQLEEVCR